MGAGIYQSAPRDGTDVTTLEFNLWVTGSEGGAGHTATGKVTAATKSDITPFQYGGAVQCLSPLEYSFVAGRKAQCVRPAIVRQRPRWRDKNHERLWKNSNPDRPKAGLPWATNLLSPGGVDLGCGDASERSAGA